MDRPDPKLINAAAAYGSATLHEAAGRIGALPSAIKPVAAAMKVCGPALTVKGPPGDNLWLHRALAVARRGDVMLVDTGGHFEAGYWGEVMTVSAQARGLAGLVINACVRDSERLAALGFPVFARGNCIRGTGKDLEGRGALNAPLAIGDVNVEAGDVVVGDGDGVVVIPASMLAEVIEKSAAREAREAEMMDRLRGGTTTLEIYGWE